ncbi:MAG: putative membrane protein YeaQ/YmgE (transglycosylase-associated protein family) [Planctomycetota bacterium]|jgi:uncharacterized membrane protein YeaQ/YmgE (transglycosylase-associated protein family)
MIRAIAAIFVGLFTAMLLVISIGALGRMLYPLPEGMDMKDAAAMASYVATIPTGALLFSLASWWLGALLGGLGACSMAKENPLFFSFIIGGALMGLVSKTLRAFDYPDWFNWTSILGILGAIFVSVILAKRLGFDNPSQSPLGKPSL